MSNRIRHSSHWGTFDARAQKDGSLAITPSPADPYPSPLLNSMEAVRTGPTRIRSPLVRKSFLNGDREQARQDRGGSQFVAVDWETALDLVAGELTRVRTEHGNTSIFGGSYGWSSAGRFHHARSQLHRFLGCFGGFVSQEQNYSYATAITFLPHILGNYEAIQGPVSSFDGIADNCEVMVCFGGISPGNMQVEAGGMGQHSGLGWLRHCVARGVRLVNIGPIDHQLPDDIGVEWIPIRPNTDTAMLLAMIHVLIEDGSLDRDFLERCCVGADRALAYVAGQTDGIAKSPGWAETICGVPAQTITELARAMARQRSFLTLSWALQRADHGEQPMWAAITLASALGHIGLPGGGFAFGLWSINGLGNPRQPVRSPAIPIGPNPISETIPVARISDMMLQPGASYQFNGEIRTYPDIRLVYWCGGNPFHHHQDLNKLVRAFRTPETVIVQESSFTATARHADIVLPATVTLERNDIGSSGRDRFITPMHKISEPVGEARDDFEIFRDLAARLEIEQAFTEGRSEMEWLAHIYDRAAQAASRAEVTLPGFEDFWNSDGIEIAAPEKPYTMYADFRADPETHRLATPSGRIELFSQTIAGFDYDDCPGHATWIEPEFWLGAPKGDPNALHLLSIQPPTRLHSQLDPGAVSMASKVNGREPCWINPEDAQARGLADGDVIHLSNARGAMLAGAVITPRVMPGVVIVATGAWYDPADPGGTDSLDKHGNPNVLTTDRGASKLTQAPIAQSVLVTLRKFEGIPPPVTAHSGPKMDG